MFEEAQLYSPVTHDEDGKAVVHLGEDHPGFNDPAYRERRNEIAAAATLWTPGEPMPQIDYTEAEDEVWRTVSRELRAQARAVRVPRVPRGEGARSRLPEDRVPQLDEVTARPEAADRLRVPPGRRARPAARVLRLARRPRLPLDAVRPPPVRAALHARAGHHPRGHRPRQPAREPALRRAQAPGRRGGRAACRPTRRCSSSPTSSGSRSSSASSARTASCAPTAPGSCPPTARSRSSATWRSARSTSSRWATLEYDITKYQPVLFAAESVDQLVEAVGGFFAAVDDDTPAHYAPARH